MPEAEARLASAAIGAGAAAAGSDAAGAGAAGAGDGTSGAALLLVTLDPRRDTPSRLPHLAQSWQLPPGAHILSGSVESVERTLDAWGVARTRNERTGEILHPVSIYLIDRLGRLAYIAPSDPGRLAALLAGL